MNSTDPKHPWMRLTAAARTTRDEREVTAPFGFATRVAALALAQEAKVVSLFERFALRAVGIACLLALTSVAVNYKTLAGGATGSIADNGELGGSDDAVAIVLDLTD
jgi:hypothetical protein